jgi:hypothetical protein
MCRAALEIDRGLQAACERLTALQLNHLRVLLLRGQERLC